ncbi:hypothetical protein [uncultured Gammaproteobacteria bacterium]|nr:hypothetical protein [uncultured Gammaproteobacteria bacterium]CAC9977611.1 hypothetical protein [uncultured Gammaproteobacteria bacterium]
MPPRPLSSFLKIPSAGYRTKSGSMPINSSALLWDRFATANSATNEFDARYSLAANATSGFHSIECQVSPRYSLLSKTTLRNISGFLINKSGFKLYQYSKAS